MRRQRPRKKDEIDTDSTVITELLFLREQDFEPDKLHSISEKTGVNLAFMTDRKRMEMSLRKLQPPR